MTTPETELLIARFFARVRALTPTQWGELDAIAQKNLNGLGPRWRHAQRFGASMGARGVLRDIVAGIYLAGGLSFTIKAAVLGKRRMAERNERWAKEARSRPPRDGFVAACKELDKITNTQPVRCGAAWCCLHEALTALWFRPRMSDDAFRAGYAPVEPIIPFASL